MNLSFTQYFFYIKLVNTVPLTLYFFLSLINIRIDYFVFQNVFSFCTYWKQKHIYRSQYYHVIYAALCEDEIISCWLCSSCCRTASRIALHPGIGSLMLRPAISRLWSTGMGPPLFQMAAWSSLTAKASLPRHTLLDWSFHQMAKRR